MSPSKLLARSSMVAVVGLLACSAAPPDPPPRPSETLDAASAGAPLPDFRDYVVGEIPEPAVEARDPFHDRSEEQISEPVAESAPRVTPTPIVLRGIVERDGRRVALLGRGARRVGESVAGWKVIQIEAREVVLERDGQRRRLKL